MKIAIHHKQNGFSKSWIDYCEENRIPFKIVNCYEKDIINQVEECDALMWHFHQANSKDMLFAKQLIYSLQTAGKKVFPGFNMAWHFDDKVGQKYLLEAIGAPLVSSYVFYDKREALQWIEETSFPKVFKLRKGAGSSHVKLAKNRSQAKRLVNKAFGRGFSQYDKLANLKGRWYNYRTGKTGIWNVIKGVFRLVKKTEFARIAGREKGYVYFQDYIPGNDYDIRVIVIEGKAFAIKRLVREGDFRASGSGHILYEKRHFDEDTIRLSFDIAEKLNSKCLALDYVYKDDNPLIVEISYGFTEEAYDDCVGYWDPDFNWHEDTPNPQGWMVESLIEDVDMYNDKVLL